MMGKTELQSCGASLSLAIMTVVADDTERMRDSTVSFAQGEQATENMC